MNSTDLEPVGTITVLLEGVSSLLAGVCLSTKYRNASVAPVEHHAWVRFGKMAMVDLN
jgi:hypothetical protein